MDRFSGGKSSSRILQITLFALALTGFGINVMLLIRRLGDASATLAGCGPGSGCETVLGSRWSEILGMPVTVPGMLIYAALMLALTRAGRPLLAPLLGVIFAAAVWFIFVQAALIRAFCPWCMAAHGVGITLTVLGLMHAIRIDGSPKRVLSRFALAGIAGAFGIIALQVFGPKPATHRVSDLPAAAPQTDVARGAHSQGEGRLAVFFDGRKGYRVEELPHIGRADAPHILVEYFDYGCSACRTMGGHLDALVSAYPEDICVILLPMPLDRECNPSMPPLEPGNPGACVMARAALAVWRNSRENFNAFHYAVLADPTADNASMLASALLEDAPAAMRDPWVESIIATNITDWQVISADNAKLPKLIVGGRRIMHGFPPTEAEFIQVIADQLGLSK
jgi:uncharacterized membrane protein